MIKIIKKFDAFSRNIALVFCGSTIINIFNLIYQLLIAHKLTPADFAGFNSLLSIFMLLASPLITLQTVMAKYTSEFNARKEWDKLRGLLSGVLKRISLPMVLTFLVLFFFSPVLLQRMKIQSSWSGHILALLLILAWATPVFTGALQGMESFKWLTSTSIIGGMLKLILTLAFIRLGFGITGAMGAFFLSCLATFFIALFPLRRFLSGASKEAGIDFAKFFLYLLPVACASFCLIALVNLDMIMVKYYFPPQDSGIYSLAQMVGKIFLFLPAAISVVMLPRTSGLNARNIDTKFILKRSLLYATALCLAAFFVYNVFPSLVLELLTGKIFPESIMLGRFFSVSMSFFTLLFITVTYFLSINDLRFLKYLIALTGLEFFAIALFHRSLLEIQVILCVNSCILLLVHLGLLIKSPAKDVLRAA